MVNAPASAFSKRKIANVLSCEKETKMVRCICDRIEGEVEALVKRQCEPEWVLTIEAQTNETSLTDCFVSFNFISTAMNIVVGDSCAQSSKRKAIQSKEVFLR